MPSGNRNRRVSSTKGLGRAGGRPSWASAWAALIYHHVTDGSRYKSDDPLVSGLGVDLALDDLRAQLQVLRPRYEIMAMDEARSVRSGRRPRLVVTFDDAYASTARLAGPLLRELGVPWTFFVNPGLLDNRTVAFDNLVAYVVNTRGAAPLERASGAAVKGISNFIAVEGPRLTPGGREQVVHRLVQDLSLDLGAIASAASLYLGTDELVSLVNQGVSIGNHTADHVHCRALDDADAREQIGVSADRLRAITGAEVRAFAYPYGSAMDATEVARTAVRRAGHDVAFLVQARRNTSTVDAQNYYRISLHGTGALTLLTQLELLPRLRSVKSALVVTRAQSRG